MMVGATERLLSKKNFATMQRNRDELKYRNTNTYHYSLLGTRESVGLLKTRGPTQGFAILKYLGGVGGCIKSLNHGMGPGEVSLSLFQSPSLFQFPFLIDH